MLTTDVRYVMGLDLGRTRNHTAMAVLRREWHAATAAEFIASGTRAYSGEFRYTVVGADRLSLGTPYPRVVSWVKSLAALYGDELGEIVVDASGVGSVVMDELRKAGIGVPLLGVVITGEQACASNGSGRTGAGYVTLSRTELLMKLQVSVQGRKFRIERAKCREFDALRRELGTVRLESGSKKEQDDLAFALAMAVWRGLR